MGSDLLTTFADQFGSAWDWAEAFDLAQPVHATLLRLPLSPEALLPLARGAAGRAPAGLAGGVGGSGGGAGPLGFRTAGLAAVREAVEEFGRGAGRGLLFCRRLTVGGAKGWCSAGAVQWVGLWRLCCWGPRPVLAKPRSQCARCLLHAHPSIHPSAPCSPAPCSPAPHANNPPLATRPVHTQAVSARLLPASGGASTLAFQCALVCPPGLPPRHTLGLPPAHAPPHPSGTSLLGMPGGLPQLGRSLLEAFGKGKGGGGEAGGPQRHVALLTVVTCTAEAGEEVRGRAECMGAILTMLCAP